MILGLLIALAPSAPAQDLGGHAPEPSALSAPAEDRAATLDEMWERRILAPDLTVWAPADAELLARIKSSEEDALVYLKRKYGGTRPWTAPRRREPMRRSLTKAGFETYLRHLTQDALEFFAAKGASAKWALKLTDWEGARLFDREGLLTPAGAAVYRRARLKLEVYWKSPNGETFGTRRPPAAAR